MFFLHLHHWKWRQICQLTIYGQRRPANLFVWNQNSTKSWLFVNQKSFPFRLSLWRRGEERALTQCRWAPAWCRAEGWWGRRTACSGGRSSRLRTEEEENFRAPPEPSFILLLRESSSATKAGLRNLPHLREEKLLLKLPTNVYPEQKQTLTEGYLCSLIYVGVGRKKLFSQITFVQF